MELIHLLVVTHLASSFFQEMRRKGYQLTRFADFRLRARLDVSIPSTSPASEACNPAFGYGAPHPSAGGTSTLLISALLSTHHHPM
jgi:hypothetical protein